MVSKRLKIGLALGGGGARGLAHIGVIKVLERENIPIDIITGTSMGAIIGGVYALKKNVEALVGIADKYVKVMSSFNLSVNFGEKEKKERPLFLKRVVDFLKKGYILNQELRNKYLNEGEELREILRELVGDKTFTELKIPFAVVAADLIKGEKVILQEGELFSALLASASIPGIFPPVNLEKKMLVDGGIVEVVPIETARTMGADLIIAVNVSSSLKKKYDFNNAVEILFRSDEITSNHLRKVQLSHADVLITPKVGRFHWSDFSKPEKCIREGEIAAQSSILEIKKKLKQKRGIWWKRLFPSLK
ncbi:MAG: patatin-like phospholipase family protein [Candidatus Caldatribacteriota bacterium]